MTTALAEDEIDDVLYFARTNELDDLKDTIKQLSVSSQLSEGEVCSTAVDAESLNGALHYAAGNGHLNIVKYILQVSGAAPLQETDSLSAPSTPPPEIVNKRNAAGNTALHWAALNGHVEMILLLLGHGADPSILNAAGHDALFEAELNERQAAVEVLLREGGQLEDVVGGGGEGDGEEKDGEDEEEDESDESATARGQEEVKDIENGEELAEDVQKLSTS